MAENMDVDKSEATTADGEPRSLDAAMSSSSASASAGAATGTKRVRSRRNIQYMGFYKDAVAAIKTQEEVMVPLEGDLDSVDAHLLARLKAGKVDEEKGRANGDEAMLSAIARWTRAQTELARLKVARDEVYYLWMMSELRESGQPYRRWMEVNTRITIPSYFEGNDDLLRLWGKDFLSAVHGSSILVKGIINCPVVGDLVDIGGVEAVLQIPTESVITVTRLIWVGQVTELGLEVPELTRRLSWLVVITLPVNVPAEPETGEGRQHVFVRNDDVELIKIMAGKLASGGGVALNGTPSISKSWLLWKTLILLARPKLWEAVAPNAAALPCAPGVVFFATGEGCQPQTTAYFLKDGVALNFHGHGRDVVPCFKPFKDAVMLYEPGSSSTKVRYLIPSWGVATAAAMSDLKLGKVTMKDNVTVLYHTCPVANELLVIAWWLRSLWALQWPDAKPEDRDRDSPFPSRQEVLERMRKFGSLTRFVINSKSWVLRNARHQRLHSVSASAVFNVPEKDRESGVFRQFDYARVQVRVVPDRNGYDSSTLAPCCVGSMMYFRRALRKADLDALRGCLQRYAAGLEPPSSVPVAIGLVFEAVVDTTLTTTMPDQKWQSVRSLWSLPQMLSS